MKIAPIEKYICKQQKLSTHSLRSNITFKMAAVKACGMKENEIGAIWLRERG